MNFQFFKESNDLEDFYKAKEKEKLMAKKELQDFLSMIWDKYSSEEIIYRINDKLGDAEFLDLLASCFADDEDFHDIIYLEGDYDDMLDRELSDENEFNEDLSTQMYDVDLKADDEDYQISVTAQTPTEAKKQVNDSARQDFKGSKVKVLRATRTSSAKNGLNQYTATGEQTNESCLSEASVNTYEKFLDRTKEDFGDLISETQSDLYNSESKAEDYYILNCFWGNFMPKAIEKWDDSSELFLDDAATNPMPESVSKQFVSRLFDIQNIDVLYDLPIQQGFEDWDNYVDCINAENPVVSKEEALEEYEHMFDELESSDEEAEDLDN